LSINNKDCSINIRIALSTLSIYVSGDSCKVTLTGEKILLHKCSSGLNSREFLVMSFEKILIYSQLRHKKSLQAEPVFVNFKDSRNRCQNPQVNYMADMESVKQLGSH
jgi:hypothetical protein